MSEFAVRQCQFNKLEETINSLEGSEELKFIFATHNGDIYTLFFERVYRSVERQIICSHCGWYGVYVDCDPEDNDCEPIYDDIKCPDCKRLLKVLA